MAAQSWNSSFNEVYLDTSRLNESELNNNGLMVKETLENGKEKLNKSSTQYDEASVFMSTSVYDEKTGGGGTPANKYNSFPMRQKKSKLKKAPKSTSSLQSRNQEQLINLTQEELGLTVKMSRFRSQENDRLKIMIRTNCWHIRHPIRKYLWKCLLQLNEQNENGGDLSDKENHMKVELVTNEVDYNKHLNRIFGKCIQKFTFNILNKTSLMMIHHNSTLLDYKNMKYPVHLIDSMWA